MKRAITKSDTLVQEIFNRLEGRVAMSEDEDTTRKIPDFIILDMPRPDRRMLNITPGKPVTMAALANGSKPAEAPAPSPPKHDPRPKD